MLTRTRPHMRHAVCLLGLVTVLAGCGIPRSVVWSPDGQRIFFRTDDGELAAWHMQSRSKQIIPIDQKTWTQIPGVNPMRDGIAVVDVRSNSVADMIQVIEYDLTGQRRRESVVFQWPAQNGKFIGTVPRPSGVLWSLHQDGRYMLIWYQSGADSKLRFARFDWQDRELTPVDETTPAIDLLYAGMTPIRDDHLGYLAVRPNHEDSRNIFFVTWDGWEHTINSRRELPVFDRPFGNGNQPAPLRAPAIGPNGQLLLEMSDRLPVTAGRWLGGVLRPQLGRGRVTVDSVNRIASYDFERELSINRDQFADGHVFLRVPIGSGKEWYVQCRVEADQFPPKFPIELAQVTHQEQRMADQRPNENEVEMRSNVDRTLPIGYAAFDGRGFCPFVPAPDGRSVAVTHSDETGRIFTTVIDDTGQRVARFQVSGPGWDQDVAARRPPNVALAK